MVSEQNGVRGSATRILTFCVTFSAAKTVNSELLHFPRTMHLLHQLNLSNLKLKLTCGAVIGDRFALNLVA